MNTLKKYIWLVDTLLRTGDTGLTLNKIADAYMFDDEISGGKPYDTRTFHRHREQVKDIFGIEIACVSTALGWRYRIADSGSNDYFRRWLLDSIAVNHLISDSKDAAQFIDIENANTEHLPKVLQSLKDQQMVEFDYKPYWADASTHYFDFQPYAVKMFERRWYLIGRYKVDMPYKIYALDRISNFEIKEDHFQRDPDFNLEKMFYGVYGIIVDDSEVESVWLKVKSTQAKYLRSLPLHRSQIELRNVDGYTIFALQVRPSFDLRQRILSLGSTVEVLKPESLRNEISDEIHRMSDLYKEKE